MILNFFQHKNISTFSTVLESKSIFMPKKVEISDEELSFLDALLGRRVGKQQTFPALTNLRTISATESRLLWTNLKSFVTAFLLSDSLMRTTLTLMTPLRIELNILTMNCLHNVWEFILFANSCCSC